MSFFSVIHNSQGKNLSLEAFDALETSMKASSWDIQPEEYKNDVPQPSMLPMPFMMEAAAAPSRPQAPPKPLALMDGEPPEEQWDKIMQLVV